MGMDVESHEHNQRGTAEQWVTLGSLTARVRCGPDIVRVAVHRLAWPLLLL